MLVGGLVDLVRRHRLMLVLGVAGVAVLALVFGLLRSPGSPAPKPPEVADPAQGDRLLQSVDVAVQNDGSLTGVDSTVVIARAAGGGTDTVTTTHDPIQVLDDLPVRVLTSYRTETGAGTNLGDLTGYTGKVTIDVTVQNLTVKAQRLRYDVAGQSRTSTAMVGAPLTVVASAALPNTSPAAVVTTTTDGSKDGETTNGVLSRSAEDTTQVQWATILAPPQLAASADLRLVVDAKNFSLPQLDLTVQPGLVTDPSVGALVDAAFDPASSEEVALEARTLKLVGDVNGVLDQAGDTIATVRKTLDTTSETLGTKTVSSLKTSTESVTTSVKTSRENLKSLNSELKSSVTASNSATLSRMSDTVAQLDELLGDTSAKATPAKVKGSGCAQEVAKPAASTSVYGSLLQVSSQLDGYAGATKACKAELQRTIQASIGPAEPTTQTCADPDESSVTCALYGAESTFAGIADTFVDDSRKALDSLDGNQLDPVSTSVEQLATQLKTVSDGTDALLSDDPVPTSLETLGLVDDHLDASRTALTTLVEAVDDVHTKAVAGRAKVSSMNTQNADLADQLCALVGDGTQPGTLSAVKVEQLRSYLASRSCPDQNGVTVPLVPPVQYGAAMDARLADQATTLEQIAAATDTADHEHGAGKSLADLGTELVTVRRELGTVVDALTTGDEWLRTKVAALQTSVDQAQHGLEGVASGVGGVQSSYDDVKASVDAALTKAGDDAKAGTKASLEAEIPQVVKKSEDDSAQVGEMFDHSAAGLSRAADSAQTDGKSTVDKQRRALAKTQAQAESSLTESTRSALTQVSADVSGATRDLDATRTLLTTDLSNVLLDLGNPKVKGSGVLGTLATSAKAAGSADSQLGLASDKTSAYAGVRARDVAAVQLRQAQAQAALQRQADLPAFELPLPTTVEHRTVYVFHLTGTR